jgi:hypothetical protein
MRVWLVVVYSGACDALIVMGTPHRVVRTWELVHRRHVLLPCVVDQNVDVSKPPLRLRDHVAYARRVAQVGSAREHLDAVLLLQVLRLLLQHRSTFIICAARFLILLRDWN